VSRSTNTSGLDALSGLRLLDLTRVRLADFGTFVRLRMGTLRMFYAALSAVHLLGAAVIVAFMTTKSAKQLLIESGKF